MHNTKEWQSVLPRAQRAYRENMANTSTNVDAASPDGIISAHLGGMPASHKLDRLKRAEELRFQPENEAECARLKRALPGWRRKRCIDHRIYLERRELALIKIQNKAAAAVVEREPELVRRAREEMAAWMQCARDVLHGGDHAAG